MRLETPAGRAVVVATRLALAALFLWAAIPKLAEPAAFAEAIANYHLLPAWAIGVLAAGLPVLEIVVALALASGVQARGAAIVAGLMLLGFAAAMTQAIVRGIDLDCGCFGAATRAQVTWWSVARNVGLALLATPTLLASDLTWRGAFAGAVARSGPRASA